MLKQVATVFGAVLLVVGVLGFIPGVTNDGLLLGIFHVDTLHNIVHLLTGAIGLYVGLTSASASKTYFQVFGIVYLIIAILGLIDRDDMLLGILASNMADTVLHLVIALVSLYLGFGTKEEEVAAA